MRPYDDDLAHVHDAGFGGFATGSAPGLLAMLRRGGVTGGLVVDLGCGSGLWAAELVRAGYAVLGIDISAAMLDIARRRAPSARFVCDSLLRVELPPCDAVTSLGECFNYLFDETNSKKALARLFARVHQALRPGGLFVFDVAEPGRATPPRSGFREGDDWAVLFRSEEDPKKQLLTRHITTFRRAGELYRRAEEVHRLRLYRGTDLARELRRAGFAARLLRGYGDYRFQPTCVGLLARKR
jgi:SAM-dependent methyltransferase